MQAMVRMQKSFVLVALAVVVGAAGCASRMTSYSKPDAPWRTIQKVGVLPFSLALDNSTRQQLVTQLFIEQLRKTGLFEVVEIPPPNPAAVPPTLQEIAKKYEVDGLFTGSVDDSQGTIVHIQLHDPATEEILWSGTYSMGVGSEFFSLHTQEQQFQHSIQKIVEELSRRKK